MDNIRFHQLFADALTNTSIGCDTFVALKEAGESIDTKDVCHSHRRFDIYRNNRAMSLIEVLASTYPALVKLLGEEFFNAAARAFIDVTPPKQPVMAEYGMEFGAFIASLPNTEKLPFLPDVASIDWHKLQAYHSEDVPVLVLSDLAEIKPEVLMESQLQIHPALSCIESQWPVGSIWTICTDTSGNSAPANSVDMSQPETILITRPQLDVQVNRIDSAAAKFLQTIRAGLTLGSAAEQVLGFDETFDAGQHLTGLVSLGAFAALGVLTSTNVTFTKTPHNNTKDL